MTQLCARRIRLLLLTVACALLAVACSTTAEVTADDPADGTPTPEQSTDDDTGSANPGDAPGDRDAPRSVPPFSLPAVAPGSDQAYDELIASLERFLEPDQLDTVPWPDLRNPDPIAAYRASGYRAQVSDQRPAVSGAGGGIV